MTMKKYAQGEGKLEVLAGAEAQVVHDHMQRTGKYQLSEFDEGQMSDLQKDLEVARSQGDASDE